MDELIQFARHLANESALVIKHYFRNGYAIELKEDQTPVTIADRRAEEVMRELIAREFPDHGILGEEFGHDKPDAAYQWVLDPIDGTKAFVAGSYLFGTLIALVQNGRPILGVINHPIIDHCLLGTGTQTWLNEQPVTVRPCARLAEAFLVSTYHNEVGDYQDPRGYNALAQQVWRYRTWGDCHGYYLLATGGVDIMIDPILSPWDLMALIPVVEGAGGRITDWFGNDPIGGSGVVATAGGVHDEVVRLLNQQSQP